MQILESQLERRAIMYAKYHGMETIKLTQRGWPDRAFICKDGKVVFIEFKAKGQNPRSIQVYWIVKLQALGHVVKVVHSFDDFTHVISKYS